MILNRSAKQFSILDVFGYLCLLWKIKDKFLNCTTICEIGKVSTILINVSTNILIFPRIREAA